MTYLNNFNTLSEYYSRYYQDGDTVLINNYDDLNYFVKDVKQVALIKADVSELIKFIHSGKWEVVDTAEYTNYGEIVTIDGEDEYIDGIDMIRQAIKLGELTEEEAEKQLARNEKLVDQPIDTYQGFLLKKF